MIISSESVAREWIGDVQNPNAPEMIPFAIATGNNKYASLVNGQDSAAKRIGGITSRNLNHPVRLYARERVTKERTGPWVSNGGFHATKSVTSRRTVDPAANHQCGTGTCAFHTR